MNLKVYLSTFTLALSLTATSEEVLAIKQGPFQNFEKCSLSASSGTLEINTPRHKLLDTSDIQHDFYDLDTVVLPAIAGTQRPTYRWFATQTDYFIADSKGELAHFYAVGYLSITNQSKEAQTLMNHIDQISDNQLPDFRILGEFQIDLKIGERIFPDKLKIKRNHDSYGVNIEGIYSVPNSFESPLKNLNYQNGNFSFTIRVQEGEDDYLALFEGELMPNDEIKGKAYFLSDRRLLGTFTGTRL